MASEIVGREAEFAAVLAFIGEAEAGPAALVLEGEPGIGKSTLWRAGLEHAHARGLRILSSRPAEAERGLAHLGLGDLLEDALDDVLDVLPPPRRHALEVALLREESEKRVDSRALAVAVRDAIHALATNGRVLIAIDDVQWLDASSSSALSFALRRLAGCDLRVLLARRLADGVEASDLEGVLDSPRLAIGPLSAGALHRLLHDRLGRSFARQTLLRIHERSGGNPLFALEIAHALPDQVDPLEPLPVSETLDQLVRGRLEGLPRPTRDALALAAAWGTPSTTLLARAGVDSKTLEPALAAHVIECEKDVIRFTHPLLASGVYDCLGEERLGVHARLAEIADDPLVRARHRALATRSPNDSVARTLDAAATLAGDRGAAALAAELAEHALRLTPGRSGETRHRRAFAAARAHLAAGEWTRARAIVTELLAETQTGELRAEALLLLAEFEHDDLAVPVLEEALREALPDTRLEAVIRLRLARAERFRTSFTAALERTRTALELADRLGDNALRFDALVSLQSLGGMAGDPETPTYVERAQEIAAATGDAAMLRVAKVLVSGLLIDSGDIDTARALLEREYAEWRHRDELFGAELLWELAWLELWAGRWELAADHAANAREIRAQYGVEKNQDYIPITWVAVHRGRLELADDESERALKLCEEQIGFHPPLLAAVPGLVALWSGDAATAAAHLGEADRQAAALGWRAADARPWTGDYVEALLELGRIDDAIEVVDRWEADATRLPRTRVSAQVVRCRGLLAAARGDVEQAVTLLARAIDQHDEAGDAFGRARALFALGVVRRRARLKRPAREAIEGALAGFQELGAATWVEKAQAELGSIGGRKRVDGLTAAERRVAVLVAEGRTNREVAAALFLGERTVAGHLTRVYSKLGVRSRVELARRLD